MRLCYAWAYGLVRRPTYSYCIHTSRPIFKWNCHHTKHWTELKTITREWFIDGDCGGDSDCEPEIKRRRCFRRGRRCMAYSLAAPRTRCPPAAAMDGNYTIECYFGVYMQGASRTHAVRAAVCRWPCARATMIIIYVQRVCVRARDRTVSIRSDDFVVGRHIASYPSTTPIASAETIRL